MLIVCRWRPGTLAHDTSPTYLPLPTLLLYSTLQGVVRAIFGRHQPGRLRRGARVRRAHPQVPARPLPRAGLAPPGGCIPPLPVAACPPPPAPAPTHQSAHPGPKSRAQPWPNPNQGNTIREFSFLENPRAAALKASTASTTLVAGAGAAAELKRLVASYAETKVRPHRDTAPAT